MPPLPRPRATKRRRRSKPSLQGPTLKGRLRNVLWLSLPTLAVLLLVFGSTRWHLPTRVGVDVTTRRLAFVVGGEESREILGASVQFSSLVIEDCAEVSLTPEWLKAADPLQFVLAEEPGQPGHYPESAWRELKSPATMRLLCADEDARVTLRGPAQSTVLGTLGGVRPQPGSRVVLEVPPGRGFEIAVRVGGEHSLSIPTYEDVTLVTDLVELEGGSPFAGDLLTYRTRLGKTDPVRVRSRESGLTLVVAPAGSSADDLFSGRSIPLVELELHEQGVGGRAETSLVAEGKLSYPGFEKIPAIALAQDELLGFGKLGVFQLESLEPDAKGGGLKVRLDGEVGLARATDEAFPVDLRLSVYQRLRYGPLWQLLAGAAAWALSTTWVAYERWKKVGT